MQSGAAIVQGLSPESALVVDADQDYVKAIRAALVDDIASVEAVTSISSAVTRLQGNGHRLVIIDSSLGGDPTAVDLVRALRRTRPEVAIIMTSSTHLTATQDDWSGAMLTSCWLSHQSDESDRSGVNEATTRPFSRTSIKVTGFGDRTRNCRRCGCLSLRVRWNSWPGH